MKQFENAVLAEVHANLAMPRHNTPCFLCHSNTTLFAVFIPNGIFSAGRAAREFLLYPLCSACQERTDLPAEVERKLFLQSENVPKIEPGRVFGFGFIHVIRAFAFPQDSKDDE